jgi:murein DD-endopeptidase MepM/ murein hydrolase activator NlpD
LSRGGLGRSVTPADIHDALQGALVSIDPARETLEKLKEDVTKEQHRLAHTPNGWPVRGTISSYFGARRSPFGRRTEFHEGIDIAAPSGTAVKATGAGTVTFAGWYSGYGYMLVIDHGYGYQTAYAHNSKLNVSVGQTVVRGDTIAYVGSSGRSTGPHLHYEVRYLGVKKDPGKYL